MAVDYRSPHAMSQDEVASALFADLEDAVTFIDAEVGPQRAVAIHFYRANDFGDEEEGRSAVVMPIVRDTIRATLPSLMKKFFGGRQVVRFLPSNATAGDFSDQATNSVNFVFNVQNNGFQVCWNAFKDALRSKTGFIKYWWDESVEVCAKRLTGLNEQQVMAAQQGLQPGEEMEILCKTQVGVQMVPVMQPNPEFARVHLAQPEQLPNEALHGPEGSEHPADDRADYASNANIPTSADQNEHLTSGTDASIGQGTGGYDDAEDSVDIPGQWHAAGAPPGAVPGMQPMPVYAYDVRIITKRKRNQVRVVSVPTDEIVWCRDGWEWDKLRIRAHRTRKTRGELVAMGVKAEDLEEIPQDDVDQMTNMEFLARQITPGVMPSQSATATWDQVRVPYYECYYFIDADGDGISELRKICRIGRSGKIVSDEIVDECPIQMFCPDPEPHVTVGLSQADYLMDLQLINSHVWRDILDSLKQSIFPRTAYVEGQVNPDDVLNTEIGAAIRMRAPGMVQPIEIPFTGQQAFPLLENLDQVREQRTGIGQAAMALDGSALQSTTPAAAQATIQASQAQVELIARLFAEGMKGVYRGILRLLCRHVDGDMAIVLNGQPLVVNPGNWDSDMQVMVDTALGSGSTGDRLNAFGATLKMQQAMLPMPGNQLCGQQQVYNTLTDILQEAGLKDSHRYWTDPSKQPPPPPPGPTQEQQIAALEMALKGATLDKDRLKIVLDDEREREKNTQDAILKAIDIHAKYGTQVDVAHIQALISRERNASQAQIAQMQPSLPQGGAGAQ